MLVTAATVGLFPSGAGGAQDDTTTPVTETTTTTTTSTLPPVTTTTTTTVAVEPAPTTTLEALPEDPTAGEEAPPESVPDVDVTVPRSPASGPPPMALRIDAATITAAVEEADAAVVDARARVEELTARLAELERGVARIDVAHAGAVADALAAREAFDRRVTGAYVRGNASGLETLVVVSDVIELQMAQTLLASAAQADVDAITTYVANRQTLEAGLVRLVDAVADTRSQLRTARRDLRESMAEQRRASYRYAIVASGSDMIIDGFVFPVGRPYNFIDSWGYPRMIGTEYAHGHQGVDIMAPFGTPLYACERGVISRVGTDTLGGIKLWLHGESGTAYYYAHLQGYAAGIVSGTVVEAGQVVGTVGDTGNARGGAPHLHFQVHPGGGAAVNPYPLLRSVADLEK